MEPCGLHDVEAQLHVGHAELPQRNIRAIIRHRGPLTHTGGLHYKANSSWDNKAEIETDRTSVCSTERAGHMIDSCCLDS